MILRFENVSYRYPNVDVRTLREINLTVQPGQHLLLAGASGSGKSTLCRAAIGLIPHFHGGHLTGRIFVDGLDTRAHPVYKLFSHAGLVFQNPDAQLFNRTVEAELAYGLESLGMASDDIEQRLIWAISLVGLGPLLILLRSVTRCSGSIVYVFNIKRFRRTVMSRPAPRNA